MPILGTSLPSPLALPGASTIGDLSNEVIIKCENRASDLSRAYNWTRDALIEISTNVELRGEFDALETLGPTFNLTPNLQEYDFSLSLVNIGDTNLAGLDILIWQDPPTNKMRTRLRQTHYQHADGFTQPSPSRPQMWYRFSDTIGFIPTPDKSYQVQARLYRLHPFNEDLKTTPIYLPREWYEILTLAALERGWIELEEYEKATTLHQIIFGDPKDPGHPGLISGLKHRRQRESWRNESSLRPVVARYGRTGR